MNLIRELGAFTFASRLMRLSERLKSEVSTVYHSCGMDFDDHWFLVGYMLSEHSTMSVADMASKLSVSQPRLTRNIEEMVAHGLVKLDIDPVDPGQKLVSLTDDGEDTVAELRKVWEAVGDATAELISESHPEFLEALTRIEDGLEERSLFSRVSLRINNSE
ncbi:MAG: winged helix-turn-helix transcriptional regulator [Candidatus Krumholzibacteria bacterium]|nr:winged helix-turn-helix transcriptional regulator [Candidatus Krumholzibacteria bacterium]